MSNEFYSYARSFGYLQKLSGITINLKTRRGNIRENFVGRPNPNRLCDSTEENCYSHNMELWKKMLTNILDLVVPGNQTVERKDKKKFESYSKFRQEINNILVIS